ncbi:hypothetical protein [Planifilum fimeticola]
MNPLDHKEKERMGGGKGDIRPEGRIADLYRSGWSLVDIAASLDRSIREVVEVLRQNGIPPKPEHLQEAEAHLYRERELSLMFRKRTPSGKS